MLDNTPDNQRNAAHEPLSLARLGVASNHLQVLNALTLDAIESAALPELERALEVALEWPATNRAFSDISQALLEDQDSAALGFKSRLCAAYAQTLEQMSGLAFDSHIALKLLRLVKSTELAIDTLTLTGDIRAVADFKKLPEAMLNLAASLFHYRYQNHQLALKKRIVESLAREIIPKLDEADVLDLSFRRELTHVVRNIFAQEDIFSEILKDKQEDVNYWLNVLDLAQVAQSKALQPMLMHLTEYLAECYRCSDGRIEGECGMVTLAVLLASAISALSATGESARSQPLLQKIYTNSDVLSPPWNEAFLALSRLDLRLTYEQLPHFVDDVLTNHNMEADLSLLKFLHIPAGARAITVELSRIVDQSLVEALGLRYLKYFDSTKEGALSGHARDREILSEVFAGYGIKF